MTPRTLAPAPVTDRHYWRRLLRLAHPDGAGDHSLFLWVSALREHVACDDLEDSRTTYQRRQPPQHPTTGERLDFTAAYDMGSFEDLTARALAIAEKSDPIFGRLLRMLASCYPVSEADTTLYRAQHIGSSYKQLAYIAHLSGMDSSQRREWYRVCESIPLSQRHAGHLIAELQARAA